LGIAGMGAVGIAILVYTVEALVFRHATAKCLEPHIQHFEK
jgi:hypothetical protein